MILSIRHRLSHRLSRAICLALAACAIADPAAAQEIPATQFSATLVSAGTEGIATGVPGRIHVSGDKVRLETPEVRDGYFVVDGHANTAYFVRPALHTFMEARQ